MDEQLTLPNVRYPNRQYFKDCRWFIGLDPAVKVDYYGVIVHGLWPRPDDGSPWMPWLARAYNIKHDSFTDIMHWLKKTLFEAFPPTAVVIDATRDTPSAEDLIQTYGHYRIKDLKITNKTNRELKATGLKFMKDGYKWPINEKIRDNDQKTAVMVLHMQCIQERVLYTRDNQEKFEHPPGEHNDLNRAWEMSLMSVAEFQAGKLGGGSTGFTMGFKGGGKYEKMGRFKPVLRRKPVEKDFNIDWSQVVD